MCWRRRKFEARLMGGNGFCWTPQVLYLTQSGFGWLVTISDRASLHKTDACTHNSRLAGRNHLSGAHLYLQRSLEHCHACSFPNSLGVGVGVTHLVVWLRNYLAPLPQCLATIPTDEATTYNKDTACSDAALSPGLWHNYCYIIPQSN